MAKFAEKMLFPESSGILAWMVRGYMLFLEEGLAFPKEMEEWRKEWVEENDPIAIFFDECVRKSDGHAISSKDLHVAYQRWSITRNKTKNDHKNGPKGYDSIPTFGRRIAALHQRARHTSTGQVYDGIALNKIFQNTYQKTKTRAEEYSHWL